MAEVVALVGAPGPAWVDEMRRWWDRGDAILPIDDRLPAPAAADLLHALAPTKIAVIGGDVTTRVGRPAEPGDAIVLATSGTTGASKGVILTHANVEASAAATSRALAVEPGRDGWICCLPLAHAGGLGVVTRALHSGTRLTVLPGFDATLVTDAAATFHAEGRRPLVSLVATALRRIDPGLFRVILLGGDAPPSWPEGPEGPEGPDGRPPAVVVTYGMTETGGGCVYDGTPLEGTEVRITDDEEILLRSATVARAYRTAAADHPLPTDTNGWYRTGDGGHLDDGRLVVDGRLDDVIVTGGEKVWPAPVERVLAACPGVAGVAIVGRPDPEWGHRVAAVVVPTDPASPPSFDSLRAAVGAVLPPWAVPKSLELVDALPTTALGKVRRAALSPDQ